MLAVAVVALFGLAACGPAGVGSTTPSTPETTSSTASPLVGPAKFAAAIADPVRITINVHVPFEGRLAGTDLMIPYDQIPQQVSRLPADRTRPLAIYCRSGPMSAAAARSLAALGYTDIVELAGGMQAWQASGRPVSQTRPSSR
ncbi:MAG: rhodanese-like domain-containing protein [Pseudonocardiaceae bacterium]|nr:rhodanese-like domain-containing protein [Pseudonocardiaceae bacterium]